MVKRPSQTQDKFIIRLPDGMRNELKEIAEKNHRSMTEEIVHRLKQSLLQEQESWLEKAQNSPVARLRKEMIVMEARLEDQIAVLREDIATLQNKFK